MKLVRSDSPDVALSITSAGARASRYLPAFVYGCSLNALVLLIAIAVSLIVSVRAAAWFGVPVFLAWNVYVIWLLKSSRRNWCVAVCAERVYVRLGVNVPDVIVLEASEIASIVARTVEMFLYGSKPKFVEWLVIEPAQAVEQGVPDHITSFLRVIKIQDPSNLLHVANEEGRLTIGWKWCHPALQLFLQQVVRECPSISIAPEERSELDLNGIWHGPRGAGCTTTPDARPGKTPRIRWRLHEATKPV